MKFAKPKQQSAKPKSQSDRPKSQSDRPKPQSAKPKPQKTRPSPGAKGLSERPLREDLVTQACLEAYGSVRHEGRLADRALDFTLRHKQNLYANERRAVAERVYSLLRRQLTVEFGLGKAAKGFGQLPTSEQDLLRLATSRALDGDNVETVAKHMALNANQRALVEAAHGAVASAASLPEVERLSVMGSLPKFVAERFFAELGGEAFVLAEAMNQRAPLCVRLNSLKTTRDELIEKLGKEGVVAKAAPLSPFGLVLETRINAFSLETFRDGLFELQDEGSQILGMLVDPPPRKVVDACAGAGGKTLQLSAEMKNRGELFALDIDEERLEDLRKRARRAGAHNVRVHTLPMGEAPELPVPEKHAERVLVDAPCSGSGTYRRKPDARYRLNEDELNKHVRRQKELLQRFSTLVKPGGRLIYGTCSVLREENETVVEEFLAKNPDFKLFPVANVLGPELGDKVGREGYLRLFPHKHNTDGFFGAVLIRDRPVI